MQSLMKGIAVAAAIALTANVAHATTEIPISGLTDSAILTSPYSGVTNDGIAFTISSPSSFLVQTSNVDVTTNFANGVVGLETAGPLTIKFAQNVTSFGDFGVETTLTSSKTFANYEFDYYDSSGTLINSSGYSDFTNAGPNTQPAPTTNFGGAGFDEIIVSSSIGGPLFFGNTSYVAPYSPPTGAVPEPSTWAMMLLGFGALGFALRRKDVRSRRDNQAATA